METWEAALNGRRDLDPFGSNKLLLFALALHQDIDDIVLTANDVLTDGPNDKKCDLVYFNPETGKVIIAQGYWSNSGHDKAAPANKASDLNTAASWLLSSGYEKTPEEVRSAAQQLHEALNSNSITSIEFWYVHNRQESDNVKTELQKVVQTATGLIRTYHPAAQVESISASEVGRATLDTWYRGTLAPILVTGKYEFETKGGFRSEGENWAAYSTSVPASWLRDMYQEHGRALFSANVRDYLGSRQSDRNINNNIKQTATEHPTMFWVYNNGITALVNDFVYTANDDAGALEITDIAIVNGAQTTGALGAIESEDLANAYVLARFVKCNDAATVQDIIRYNNSQNRIEAADFRSNDIVQTRLRKEFNEISEVDYTGGRRGGVEDAMRRPRSTLPSYAVGQALMAFHGNPAVAYNQRSHIWQSDNLYSLVFNTRTTAQHILCAYSLMKAIDESKTHLRNIPEPERTEAQQRHWEILRKRGATFLFTSAIAASLETILNKPIPDRFSVRFNSKLNISESCGAWKPVIETVLSLVTRLGPALEGNNLKNRDVVSKAIDDFVDVLGAVREPNSTTFDTFSKKLLINQEK